ncbi:unnamed protein product [Gongylonema pulchrum]|uniref:Polysacc_synt_4 domain-containing protein n=1 Tax=Gongylonema pulchrum TaxID=637853 RepID=A0A183DX16_9BILA|nr:unnamed protein product [Gongylonema pulchrum]
MTGPEKSPDVAEQVSFGGTAYSNEPSVEVAWAVQVTEVELKGENKQRWYTFCEHFREEIKDYNLGTIMRIGADGAYTETNTIIVPKIIYLAIEIARNKEGLNERHKESFKIEHEKISREGGNICYPFCACLVVFLKAAERASIHMSLLMACDTKMLTMHKKHNDIYEKFREMFPDLNVERVTEVELKGENKQRWYTFCEHFREEIKDYNLGTIMRIGADGAYSESNTIIVPKIIYLAIEIARNKEAL